MRITLGLEITAEASEAMDRAVDRMADEIAKIMAGCITITHHAEVVNDDGPRINIDRMIANAMQRHQSRRA